MKKVGQIYREGMAGELEDGLDKNSMAFLISYSQLSGAKINEIRKTLKGAGAQMYVAKNRIAKRALKELQHDELADKVSGQTAIIWSNSDSVEVSKILVNFVKEIESLKLQGGVLEGRVLQFDDVKRLSDLPSRQVLLSTLLGTIQAPITRLMSAMNAKSRDLLSILKQLSEKKGGN